MAFETKEINLSMNRIDDPFMHPDLVSGSALTANVYTVTGVTNADGSPRQLSIGQLVMALCLARASELEAQIITLMEEMNETSTQLEALTEIEEGVVLFEDGIAKLTDLYLLSGYDDGIGIRVVSYYSFLKDDIGMDVQEAMDAETLYYLIVNEVRKIESDNPKYSPLSEIAEKMQSIYNGGNFDFEGYFVIYNGRRYSYYEFLHGTKDDASGVMGMGMTSITKLMDAGNLITEIEAKMDELNSFSQQKMIELQSLTNKRDQSYDMISNILKSLHTTLIGNVNNM